MVAPESMVGDGMEVVQGASPVGGKSRVADAGEGGEGANSGEAEWMVLVGFVAEGIVVVDTGVKSRVAGGDTSMHGMQSLDRVATRATMVGRAWGESGSLEVVRLMEERAGKRVVMVAQSAAKWPVKWERRAGCAPCMPRPPWSLRGRAARSRARSAS